MSFKEAGPRDAGGGADRGAGGAGGGGRVRPPRRTFVVSEVSELTPQLIRVVAEGDLQNWQTGAPGGHFKLFAPQIGEDPAMRTYTPRHVDAERGRLTVDFALHADGPATAWVRRAAPGEEIQISGMARAGYAPSESSSWTVFIADQSALPAVAAIAEALPSGYRAKALIEIPTTAEELELASDAELEISWIVESGAPCEQLVAAALALALPEGEGEIWVGCEADSMREIRRHLLHELGLSPRSLHTRAYWKHDVANHPDHDTGEEIS
jgi:NADPH-dependent ferric siderophore reductase